MSHDPEREAAAYLGGVMRVRGRRRFEDHLLDCEDCWREVAVGRLGRRLAESARELASPGLRETIRAAVAASPVRRRAPRWPLVGASLALVLAGSLTAVRLTAGQPAPIAQAVADFRQVRMPTEAPASAPGPDLSALELSLTSSGSGPLDGLHVDAYTYRDPQGRRLLLFLSDESFPVADGARQSVAGGPWRARVADLELLCSDRPHALLALSEDPVLLEGLADRLGIGDIPA